MAKITEERTTASDATNGLAADALRAEAWAGEPFLHPDEDAAVVLAPGTSRRRALDEALAEIEAGRRTPSPQWRVGVRVVPRVQRGVVPPAAPPAPRPALPPPPPDPPP